MKMYGAPICKHCVAAKKELEARKLQYDFVDITESTANMKEFLKLRDTREEFEPVKQGGYIGIPCFLLEGDVITFDPEEAMKECPPAEEKGEEKPEETREEAEDGGFCGCGPDGC